MKLTVKFAGIFAVLAFALTAVTADAAFTRDLTLGSTGSDVMELQQWLNSKGYTVAATGAGSVGMESTYFGPATKAALAKWQAANGVTPAMGYFGPITRAKVAMGGVVVPPSDNGGDDNNGDLSGGDGDFDEYDVLGNPDSTDIEEGETEEVFGFEFEANDSDLLIERVDIVASSTNTNVEKPWKVLEEVAFVVEGDELVTVDASDEDNWDEIGNLDGNYKLRFNDIDWKVEEGESVKAYITVTASGDLDSDELGSWDISLEDDGIRALNADGIQVYEGDINDVTEFTLDEATEGDLTISVDSDENEDRTVEVDDDNDTNDEVLYIAQVESEEGDNVVEEVSVTIATTTGTTNGLSDFIKTLYLFVDGDEVGSETVSDDDGSEAVVFDDLDIEIAQDEEVDFEVRADFDNQDGNYATTTPPGVYVEAISISFVDEQDDDQTATDSSNGGAITLSLDALAVELADTPSAVSPLANDESKGRFFVEFTVSAPSNEDIYIPYGATTSTAVGSGKGAEFLVVDSSGATVTATTTDTNNVLRKVSGASDTGSYYKISKGNTATFSLEVIVDNNGASAARTLGIALTGVNHSVGSAATPDVQFTSGLDEDFRSDTAYLLTANTSN